MSTGNQTGDPAQSGQYFIQVAGTSSIGNSGKLQWSGEDEIHQQLGSLQIENTKLKYICREIDGKEAAIQLTGLGLPQLEIADMIGKWETNRDKLIGEIVAQVLKAITFQKS